mgnify:CR=1 FL=1
MTDNERHERLAVLADRCKGCSLSSIAFFHHQYTESRCLGSSNASHVTTWWRARCVVASTTNWARAPGGWWDEYAGPGDCTAASEFPCPMYRRDDP